MKTIKLTNDKDLKSILGKRISYVHHTMGKIDECIIDLLDGIYTTYMSRYTDNSRVYSCYPISSKYPQYLYVMNHTSRSVKMLEYIVDQEVILLDEKDGYYYLEGLTRNNIPYWAKNLDKPILCYVSDISEEKAVEEGYMSYIHQINNYNTPFRGFVRSRGDAISDIDTGCTINYKYAVPVVINKREELQKQLDEAQNIITRVQKELKKSMSRCELHCGDNLDYMRALPDNHVDLIYCDILYGTGKKFKDYQDLKSTREVVYNHYLPRLKEMHKVINIHWNHLSTNGYKVQSLDTMYPR